MGHEAMKKMAVSHVLISGMKGLGAEVAKNVILGGVKSVTLHDTESVEIGDLSSHFYFTENDVGRNRAQVSRPKLAELNNYVAVTDSCDPISEDIIKAHSVVVLCNTPLEEQLRIAEITRANNVSLIIADIRGLYAQVFTDFGEKFLVSDVNGEEPISAMIASVTQDKEGGVVATLDETRHGFEDGDVVTFTEVEGMTELNHSQHKIKVMGPYTFRIGDTSGFGDYVKGGIATQVKVPVEVHFQTLKQAIDNPSELFMFTDFGKFDAPPQLHLSFLAMHEYKKLNSRLPKPWSSEDAADFLRVAKQLNAGSSSPIELSDDLIMQFAKICAGDISPMAAAIGGVVAQEVMKACSGKFMPIKQWMYFDARECLPEDTSTLNEEVCKPTGSRYDGIIAIFGKDFQTKLTQQKYMIVGAGAIGCELLKNFALMGVGASPAGKIFVTDMDHIERSNLNRQFLFRPWDVQKPKAIAAAKAVKAMNPELNIEAHENRVGVETEEVYNDEFFENLDGVANALDNIEARTYMDRRCVFYCLPLLESGTLGTKGNTQVVIPFVTESYSSSRDPPEKSIPICTLKNFPNQIEHTLQWARDLFEGTFTQVPMAALQYLTEDDFLDNTMKLPGQQPFETLESVRKALKDDRPTSFEDCVIWARKFWQASFHNDIAQLLHNFPSDQLTSSGQLFWSGPKRCPKPLDFDPENELHLDFVYAAANLRATVYGLPINRDIRAVKEIVSKIVVPAFVPKNNVKIAINDAEAEAQSQSALTDRSILDNLVGSLPSRGDSGITIVPADFEKDDDTNFHMDFIVAASNSRASNYGIALADRHKSKLIAGRIIPAIATTTSLVGGLVGLELIKLVQGHKKVELFKNGFANLALPFMAFTDPVKAPSQEYNGKHWTLWDRFVIDNANGEMTLDQFMKWFQTEHGLEITMLSQGVSMLYSFFMPQSKRAERMGMAMSEVVKNVSKRDIPKHVRGLVFEICCNDTDGNDVEVPYVLYKLPKQ